MNATKKIGTFVLGAALIFVIAGCRKPNPLYEPEEPSLQQAVNRNVPVSGTEVPNNLIEEAVASDDWSVFSFGSGQFRYPRDWQVEILPKDDVPDLEASLRVKNTTKDVLFGAVVLPEDYFTINGGERIVNVDKYATNYSVIQVDVYKQQLGKSWATFFKEKYSDVVVAFEPVRSNFLPEKIDAVRATQISGIFSGDARIFVRKGERVYDIALIIQNENPLPLERVFNSFLRGFQF